MQHTCHHAGTPLRIAIAMATACCALVLFVSAASAVEPNFDATEPSQSLTKAEATPPAPNPVNDNPHVPRHLTGRFVQMPLQQAGDTSGGMLQVFKMNLRRLLPEKRRDWGGFLRPFLLAGKTDLQERDGRNYGLQIPGGKRVTALHIGGGADVQLGDHWRMSALFGEMIHSGSVRQSNYSRYRLSVGYDF